VKERMIMSRRDLERLEVLTKTHNKELRQIDAARLLKISDRQVRKLINRLRLEGCGPLFLF
jgi:Mn-dependent DtxR family transcriptional regulator